jgi:hypothetical protein
MKAMICMVICMSASAADYVAPDKSFTVSVPEGWRARVADVGGQKMSIIEPANGGEERILVGSGVALAKSIQELSQHAAQLSGQMLPGLRMSSEVRVGQWKGLPSAEQEYQSFQLSAWNGMVLKGEFYFAVLALCKVNQVEQCRKTGRAIFESAKFEGMVRNAAVERALVGRWANSDNRTKNTGVRDKLMYMSNWTVVFAANMRFHSKKESFVDTQTDVYGGGNVGASNEAVGTFRVFGSTLVADIDNWGRQLFSLVFYPNGQGILLNGQLFTRE